MKYKKRQILANGMELVIRNGLASDAEEVLQNFIQTHAETDFLLTYPDEITTTVQEEADFLSEKEANDKEAEIIALVDGKVAGSAGFSAIGKKYKIKHRAEFGISILKEYWGLGIGRALTETCIELAKKAGYAQLELDVVASNERAIALYQRFGFKEYGRNPKGFHSRYSGYQEVVYMRLEF